MQSFAALCLALAHLLVDPRIAGQPLLQVNLVLPVLLDLQGLFFLLQPQPLGLARAVFVNQATGVGLLSLERFLLLRLLLTCLCCLYDYGSGLAGLDQIVGIVCAVREQGVLGDVAAVDRVLFRVVSDVDRLSLLRWLGRGRSPCPCLMLLEIALLRLFQ